MKCPSESTRWQERKNVRFRPDATKDDCRSFTIRSKRAYDHCKLSLLTYNICRYGLNYDLGRVVLYGEGVGEERTLFRVTLGNVTALPEPATWAMMMLGIGAVGVGLRRRSPVRPQQIA